VDVTNAVESIAGVGPGVWDNPALVRKTLGEIRGVLPATHAQIDVGALVHPRGVIGSWQRLLEGNCGQLLGEVTRAIDDAFQPPVTWGLSVPCPKKIATLLGDDTDRSVLKAGLQTAAVLRSFRNFRLGFVTVALNGSSFAGQERALAPILRNAQLYGWIRAFGVSSLAEVAQVLLEADAALVAESEMPQLEGFWEKGEPVGGALSAAIWKGQLLPPPAPTQFFLFGTIPAGTPAARIVEVGRAVRSWTGE